MVVRFDVRARGHLCSLSLSPFFFFFYKWQVETVLSNIAKSESPRYHALIDTGALITGYNNEQVARKLLELGLTWCDGIVFLDMDDRKKVLVRATGRIVAADQCGIPLERRFAFYDQIHTTGMDIKHVVNATAVITLGKDMVFRDFAQGAYRMRGIGAGQCIHVLVIPEVSELISKAVRIASEKVKIFNQFKDDKKKGKLVDIAAWLLTNSMRMLWFESFTFFFFSLSNTHTHTRAR